MRHAQTGELSAVCILTAVHMDSRERKSTAFPPAFIARGKELLCDYELAQ